MASSVLMKPVVDETFITKNAKLSLLLPLAIVGLFVIRGIAGYIADTCMAKSGRSIARDLRVQVLGKYLRLPGSAFRYRAGAVDADQARLRQRPGGAGRGRRDEGHAAAVAAGHRDARR